MKKLAACLETPTGVNLFIYMLAEFRFGLPSTWREKIFFLRSLRNSIPIPLEFLYDHTLFIRVDLVLNLDHRSLLNLGRDRAVCFTTSWGKTFINGILFKCLVIYAMFCWFKKCQFMFGVPAR